MATTGDDGAPDTETFKTRSYITRLAIIFIFRTEKIISVILCNLLQRKRYKGENKRSDCQIKVIERVRRNGPRIVVVFLDRGEKKGILNGYLLRSVDRANERSGFNNEKVNNALYVTLRARVNERVVTPGDEKPRFSPVSRRATGSSFDERSRDGGNSDSEAINPPARFIAANFPARCSRNSTGSLDVSSSCFSRPAFFSYLRPPVRETRGSRVD